MKKRKFTSPLALAIHAIMLLLVHQHCFGFSGFLTTWRGIYPSSTSDDVVGCATCHASFNGGNPWNAYGWSVRQAYLGSANLNITSAIRSVESNDADGDGNSNLVEITLGTLPGWKIGNTNSHFLKSNTITINQPPVVTTNVDPRQIVAWIFGQGLTGNDALETADPDKDGATNREEYLFGGLANNAASFPRPMVLANGSTNPSFTVDVRVNDPEFTITPKWSQNLGTFFATGFTINVDGVSPFGSSYVRREFRTNFGQMDKVFFRVEGSLVAP